MSDDSRSLPTRSGADPLTALVRSASTVRDADLSGRDLDAALTVLLAETRTQAGVEAVGATRTAGSEKVARPRSGSAAWSRGRRRLALVAGGVVLATGGVTGVAAAAGIDLWSGFFDSPNSTESAPGEQYVNTSAPAFGAAFDAAAAQYPLPTGDSYAELRSTTVGSGALVQLTGLRGQMALISGCRWTVAWLAADRGEETVGRQAAVAGMTRSANSPDLAAVDGGGIVAAAKDRAVDAARGDTGAVAASAAAAGCK